MRQDEKQLRAEALLQCADCMGTELSSGRLSEYLRLLADVEPQALFNALDAHRQDPKAGRFFPQVADIRAKLPRQSAGLPTADEAWAIAIASYDEDESVVWTPEIEQARNAALSIWLDGDKIGARMAFRAAYERLTGGRQHKAPMWALCVGNSAERRAEAVRQAQSVGLLTAGQAQQLLPAHLQEVDKNVSAVAGLLSGKVVSIDKGRADSPAARFRAAIEAGVSAANKRQQEKDRMSVEIRKKEAARYKQVMERFTGYEKKKSSE